MTLVLYFGYQNSRAIHTKKGILPVLLYLQQNKLSITMTKSLSSVKEGLQSYCNKVYSRSSFNTMWILKYSYDLLDNFNSRFNSREIHLFKKWPQQSTNHSSWKCSNMFNEINVSNLQFLFMNKLFFMWSTKKEKNSYTENGVSTTLDFGIDNISVEFGRHIYHHFILYIKHYL
jgi:hypothetical protein